MLCVFACTVLCLAGCSSEQQAATAPYRTAGAKPNSPEAFNFVILSDRTGGHVPGVFEQAVDEVNLLRPDFVICVGDLVEGYEENEATYTAQWNELDGIMNRLNAPFYFVAGNHDLSAKSAKSPEVGRRVYEARHGDAGRAYYSFDYRGSHFVVLDSLAMLNSAATLDAQLAWLGDDMKRSAGAEHIFVIYHHPLWKEQQIWPKLAALLPREKTTIFNGHWHNMDYQAPSGIPTYVLSCTGAAIEEKGGQFRSFARVAVDHGEPTIALIPVGAIRGSGYPRVVSAIGMIEAATQVSEAHAEGGNVSIRMHNPTPYGASITQELTVAGTMIGKTASVLTGGGETALSWTLPPFGSQPVAPLLTTSYRIGDAPAVTWTRRLPVSLKAQLAPLSAQQCDAVLAEWHDAPSLVMDHCGQVFVGAENWSSTADSSAVAQAAIVGGALAFAFEVKDDQIATEQEVAWDNDGVELFWDVRADADRVTRPTVGCGQLIVVPGGSVGPARQLYWARGGDAGKLPADVKVVTRRTADGYVVEGAIPLADLGLDGGTARKGVIRLGFTVADLDLHDGKPVMKKMSMNGSDAMYRDTTGYARFTK